MGLSQIQIEEIAGAAVNDFERYWYGKNECSLWIGPRGTLIDQFASEYLRLDVSYVDLSFDEDLCGLTAYEDSEYIYEENGKQKRMEIKKNQILLDSEFVLPDKIHTLCGKRRFTLAHECAHHLLYQLEDEDRKIALRKQYAERRAYSLRELKNREDQNEWQANALGAAILMPEKEMRRAMSYYAYFPCIISYDGTFDELDNRLITKLCEAFRVSKTAMKIRLKELGYIEYRYGYTGGRYA